MARKLDTAFVFEQMIDIYRRYWQVLLGAAVVLYLVVVALFALASALLLLSGGSSGVFVSAFATFLFGLAVVLVVTFVYDAMVVALVSDVRDGRMDQSVGALLRSIAPVLVPLIVASLIAGVGILFGFLLLLVPGLVLVTWWALVAPAVILERRGPVEALGRSRALVRGNGWRVFGILLVIWLLIGMVNNLSNVGDSVVVIAFLSSVVNILVAPLHAIAVATIFFELKAIHGERVPRPMTGKPALP